MNPEEIEIEATAAHPSLGRDPVPGVVRFKQHVMRFESEAFKVELPLDKLLLQWNRGRSVDDVAFSHPDLPECVIWIDEVALDHPVFTRQQNLKQQIIAVLSRRDKRRRLKICGWALAGFAALTLLGWIGSRMAVGFVVQRVPVSYEEELGEKVFAEAQTQVTVDERNTNQLARLNAIKDRFLKVLPRDEHSIRVHVAENSVPNAFALPGGHMLFTTGLLTMMNDDDEVAAVMAHELAHVRHRHSLRQIVAAGGPSLVIRVLARGNKGMLGAMSVGFDYLLSQRFSRDYEREADESGWSYLIAADIDPRAMLRIMEKFQQEEARQGRMPKSLQPMSSHPPTEERIERIKALWEHFPDKAHFAERKTNTTSKVDR